MSTRARDPRRFLLEGQADSRRRIDGLERQQFRVINDPSHADGDPANGYATVVEGYLGDICSIDAYGIAVWRAGQWVQLDHDTGWVNLALTNAWTGTAQYRVLGNELRLNGNVHGGATGASIATLPAAAAPAGDGGNEIPVIAISGGVRSIASIVIAGSGGGIGTIVPHFTTAGSTIYLSGMSLLIN